MKKFLAIIGTVIVSALVALLLAELLFRLLGVGYPLWTAADPWTGWHLRPNAAGRQSDEGESWVRMNGEGWRDEERSKKKNEHAYRVAVLGDSFTEARQVDLDETFAAIAQQTCPMLGERPVEVLNFGVSGFGTAQELLAWRHYVKEYQPDMVVLAFTPGNDVRNNSFALEGSRDKPYASITATGVLAFDLSFRESPNYLRQQTPTSRILQWKLSHSRVLQLLYRVYKLRRQPQTAAVTAAPQTETGLDDQIFKTPTDQKWIDAWAITDALLTTMHREVTEYGARFLLMTTTQGWQVHPDPVERAELAERLGAPDLLEPERRLERLARNDDMEILALAEPFQSEASETGAFYHGFDNTEPATGHWNEAGHALAGKLLGRAICGSLR